MQTRSEGTSPITLVKSLRFWSAYCFILPLQAPPTLSCPNATMALTKLLNKWVWLRSNLPTHAKIHPVFHCSLLKPHHGPLTSSLEELPPQTFNNQPVIQPLTILETKLDQSMTPPQQMVLVQWQGLAPEDKSWENWQELSTTFHLEDKVVFPAVGSDTSDTHLGRPKRITSKPIRLNDYVT